MIADRSRLCLIVARILRKSAAFTATSVPPRISGAPFQEGSVSRIPGIGPFPVQCSKE